MKLPSIRQIQIIADMLRTGQTNDWENYDDLFDEPWLEYYEWTCDNIIDDDLQDPRELMSYFIQMFYARSTEHAQRCSLIRDAMDNPLEYPPASEILSNLPDLEWLWPDWIPRGLVTVLAAVPGTGKSYLALDIARRIVTGDEFPDGAPATPGAVVYADAENTPSIFKERTQVWDKKELDQIYLMGPETDRMVLNLDDPHDRDRVQDITWAIRPDLFILDSYGSATLKGENSKEDVQGLLAFFSQLARTYDMGLLIIHHPRKQTNAQTSFFPMTIDSIRGSSHIPAIARNVLGLQWIPTSSAGIDQNGPRKLWVMKSNIGRYPDPIGVNFAPHPTYPEIALLTYGDAPKPWQEPTILDDAMNWLYQTLEECGPTKPKELVAMANEEGISQAMLYRARKALQDQITNTKGRQHPNNCWKLVNEEE